MILESVEALGKNIQGAASTSNHDRFPVLTLLEIFEIRKTQKN